MFIPDPDLNFLPIPDPGSRGQTGTGSWTRISNDGQRGIFQQNGIHRRLQGHIHTRLVEGVFRIRITFFKWVAGS
jgi:hypothetical protein